MSAETIQDEPVVKRRYHREPRVQMTPEQAAQFSTWVQSRRKRLKLTQPGLASLAGVSKQYISLLEGKRKPAPDRNIVVPSIDIVDRIAHALHATPQEHDEVRKLAGYVPVSEAIFVPILDEKPEQLSEEERREVAYRSLKAIQMQLDQAMKLLYEKPQPEIDTEAKAESDSTVR